MLPDGDFFASMNNRFNAVAHDTVAQTDLVLGWLDDEDWKVRSFGVRMLSHGPVVHVATIVGMLTDPSPHLRRDALAALREHDRAATLASHAGAIAGMFTDSFAGVRYDALRMFSSDAMGMPAPDVVISAFRVVTGMLTDEDIYVRRAATKTLITVKRMRARVNWASARAYVHMRLVRPYALFWHEYVGERMCAPGGKWAERDRAAFEYEFLELPIIC